MKKISIGIMLLLQGCIPAAFVIGAAAGGAVVYDNRDMQTIVKDRNVTFQAQQKFDQDLEFKGKTHISVATFNHVAILVGQAPTAALRSKAEAIVRAAKDVKVVYNEITIDQPTSKATRTNDAWLTTKVKALLLAEKGLNSTKMKVVTENGVVYVMGVVTRGQAELAIAKTKEVTGIRKVVKLFEYVN